MSTHWNNNVNITLFQAQQYINEQNWNLNIDSIKYFGQGWDNIAFLVNNIYVFRFAKTNKTAQLLFNENKILPNLQNYFSIPITNPIFIGKPTKNNPYYFHGYKKLNGTPAYQVNLSKKDLIACIQNLATFLKQLHTIKREEAKALGAENAIFDRTQIPLVVDAFKKRAASIIEQKAFDIDPIFIDKQIKIILNLPLDFSDHCLTHGDLDARHILIENNRISGIIDWGDLGINHPVTDLGTIYSWLDNSLENEFFQIYGNVPKNNIAYAKFLALVRIITLIWYSHGINDKKLFNWATQKYNLIIKNYFQA